MGEITLVVWCAGDQRGSGVMKSARNPLAVASGTLFGLCYIVACTNEGIDGPRVVVGILFGVVNAVTMIARPERVSRKMVLYLGIPLMLALMVSVVLTGTPMQSVVFIAVGIAFLAVQLALSSLPVDSPVAEESERRSVSPEEF